MVPNTLALVSSTKGCALLRDVQPEDILGRKPVGHHRGVDLTPVIGKVTLVTGAAGSIGSELVRQLRAYQPARLILLDNNESGLHDLVTELGDEACSNTVSVLADITREEALSQVFAWYRPQVIFHAAAYKHVPMLERYPHEAVRVNIYGTWLLAGLAQAHGAERFVLISTDKAVEPSCIMGASKRLCELSMFALARQNGCETRFTSVRFGNVFGSRGSVVPTFNRQIEQGGPVTVTHREMTRFFMTTSEAVNLVIHAACLTAGGDLFMLKMGEDIRIVDLAERMIRMRGLRPYKDIEIRFTGIRPGEKLHERLENASEVATQTTHPNIVRLDDPGDAFDPTAFADRVTRLIASCNPRCAVCQADGARLPPAVADAAPHDDARSPCLGCLTSLAETLAPNDPVHQILWAQATGARSDVS
ncbi:MAG: SDR family NAD(P)-dependent oxidoreductase [Anaerolineae bacterium]|nr:SDR family NAD(P)-dependent oxidoreductase [Anaerolineae bacterium]